MSYPVVVIIQMSLCSNDAACASYRRSRTHLSLDKDCPDARSIQPPNNGKVIAIAQVDGLHHRNQHLAD